MKQTLRMAFVAMRSVYCRSCRMCASKSSLSTTPACETAILPLRSMSSVNGIAPRLQSLVYATVWLARVMVTESSGVFVVPPSLWGWYSMTIVVGLTVTRR